MDEQVKPTKYLEFQFTDGLYRVPAYIIARDRASYYAKVDADAGDGEYDDLYQAEFTYSVSSNDELMDWVRNNMDWEQLEAGALLVKNPPTVPHKKQWNELSSEGDGLRIVALEH